MNLNTIKIQFRNILNIPYEYVLWLMYATFDWRRSAFVYVCEMTKRKNDY